MDPEPPFVAQLLSEESLRKTGYFDLAAVARWRNDFRKMRAGSLPRLSVEMGLMAVVATQLWHHLFMGGGLADLPEWSAIPTPAAAEASAASDRDPPSEKLKFRQCLPPALLCFRIVFFGVRHRETLVDVIVALPLSFPSARRSARARCNASDDLDSARSLSSSPVQPPRIDPFGNWP